MLLIGKLKAHRAWHGLVLSLRACLLACALAWPVAVAAGELPPNELGRVMILEYHKIDQPEERWTRTPGNFRRDLERLWEGGYRLVALNDFVDGKIAIPRGATPVILTFDDSSPGQFKLIEKNGDWIVDPDCAVGILEAFERRHPEFGHAATFFVLPGADPPNRLFNQKELATRKLQYLASRGYEIGNHTLWHANLAKYPERVVRQQIATAQESHGRVSIGHSLDHRGGGGSDQLPPRRHPHGGGGRGAVALRARLRSLSPAPHPGP